MNDAVQPGVNSHFRRRALEIRPGFLPDVEKSDGIREVFARDPGGRIQWDGIKAVNPHLDWPRQTVGTCIEAHSASI